MKINEGSLTDNNIVLDTLEVFLDNTTFYILSGYGAFAMCGALNVDVYNTPNMLERNVICASVRGVRTFDDMLNANIYDLSNGMKALGAYKGMRVDEALVYIS